MGCLESSNASIRAEKLTYTPENYYNMSDETLNNYEKLRFAIENPEITVDLSDEEYARLDNFLFRENYAKIIRYNESYYELLLGSF